MVTFRVERWIATRSTILTLYLNTLQSSISRLCKKKIRYKNNLCTCWFVLQTAVYASLFLFFDCLNAHLSISGFFIPCSCRKSLKNSFNCRFFCVEHRKNAVIAPLIFKCLFDTWVSIKFHCSFNQVFFPKFSQLSTSELSISYCREKAQNIISVFDCFPNNKKSVLSSASFKCSFNCVIITQPLHFNTLNSINIFLAIFHIMLL